MARKKALIIGINYFGKSCQLNGCINDAANVREFLVGERGFPDDGDSLVVMTDAPENEGSLLFPSFENMVNAMKWLVADSEEGDSLWLSYSGHGGGFGFSCVTVVTEDRRKTERNRPDHGHEW